MEQGREYAILTDEITKAWSGMTTRQYKNLKGLKKENLRDNMSTLEIVLNMLAETTTTELSKATGRRALRKAGSSPGAAARWRETRGAPSKRTPGGPPSQRRTPPSSTPW